LIENDGLETMMVTTTADWFAMKGRISKPL
jgi:hypothetical protein